MTEIDHIKQTGNQPVRAVGDDDGVRLGKGLQARRQVGRLADDGFLLRRSFTDQITDDDETGGDANAGSKGFAPRRRQAGGRRRCRQAGANRPLGIVLVRPAANRNRRARRHP